MLLRIDKLLAAWVLLEPAAGFLTLVAAALLFGYIFLQLWNNESLTWSKFARFGISILNGLIFIGIVGSFYFLLSSGYKVFYSSALALSTRADVSEQIQKIRNEWGGEMAQQGLNVTQTISRVDVVKVEQVDGSDAYINKTVLEVVEQESITGFTGDINLHLADRKFNTYTIDAKYRYDVANPTDSITLAKFTFAIGTGRPYKDLLVFMDGKEIGSAKTLKQGIVSWELKLSPGQHVDLLIAYSAQGMGFYYYKTQSRKQIRDFEITLSLDTRNAYAITQPNTAAIQYKKTLTDSGYKLDWSIDNSILEPKLGVQFRSGITPDLDQKTMILLLKYTPRGMMLLTTIVLFTMIICGLYVDLRKFLMFTAIFSANFLLLMGLDLIKVNNQAVLPLTGLFSLGLIYLTYRSLPALPLRLIIAVSILFLFAYPYAGLIEKSQQRNAFDGITQAVIILYVFCLTLYIRIRSKDI